MELKYRLYRDPVALCLYGGAIIGIVGLCFGIFAENHLVFYICLAVDIVLFLIGLLLLIRESRIL